MPCEDHFGHLGLGRPYVAPAAIVGLGALAAIGNFSGVAHAESHRYIGAFAYSDSTGGYGYGVNYRSSDDADARAMQECKTRSGASDCVVVKAFGGLCAALTVLRVPETASDGSPRVATYHYVGTSESRAQAGEAGINECKSSIVDPKLRASIGEECRVLKVVCSDDRR